MAPLFTGNKFGFGASAGAGVPGQGIEASGGNIEGTLEDGGNKYRFHIYCSPPSDSTFVVSSTSTDVASSFNFF